MRPNPLCFMLPNGAPACTPKPFTVTLPASRAAATRWARRRPFVWRYAASPYWVSLAIRRQFSFQTATPHPVAQP